MTSNFGSPLQVVGSKLIILDRDGTIIENVPYLKDKSKIKIKEGVVEGLSLAISNGFELVVASNQSGVGRKLLTSQDVNEINLEISRILLVSGIKLNQFIFCPHLPKTRCKCRKPENGMIEEILRVKQIERNNSFLIGDMITDAEAAHKSGIRSYIIGNESESKYTLPRFSTSVNKFIEAIDQILKLY